MDSNKNGSTTYQSQQDTAKNPKEKLIAMSAYIKANILNFKKFNDAAQGL
jgi:hypothetical protein